MNNLIRSIKKLDFSFYYYACHKIHCELLGKRPAASISVLVFRRDDRLISSLYNCSYGYAADFLLDELIRLLKRVKTHKRKVVRINVGDSEVAEWLNSESFSRNGNVICRDLWEAEVKWAKVSHLRSYLAVKGVGVFFYSRPVNSDEKYDFWDYLVDLGLLGKNPEGGTQDLLTRSQLAKVIPISSVDLFLPTDFSPILKNM